MTIVYPSVGVTVIRRLCFGQALLGGCRPLNIGLLGGSTSPICSAPNPNTPAARIRSQPSADA